MLLNKYNTNVEQKKKYLKTFFKLIENQLIHGGSKYKGNNEKEFTDMICEAFPGETGVDFILSVCMKYLGRYKNFGREKDLLKISTYMYILWLKGGFQFKEEHDEDIKIKG